MKKAMTLTGPVEEDKLGHILPHEHIIMELPKWGYKPLFPEFYKKKFDIDILDKIKQDIWSCEDNLRLDDMKVMEQELANFTVSGGSTIVDVTTIGFKRDVRTVYELSKKTGVNVIFGTGYYIYQSHPKEVSVLSEKQIADWMIRELTDEIEDSGCKAGIIGEIGIFDNIHPDEKKVLKASIRANKETGAPISLHLNSDEGLKNVISILKEEDISPEAVILGHMGTISCDQVFIAAEHGYYIEVDCFGNNFDFGLDFKGVRADSERINLIKVLASKGFLNQLLISSDICLKILLRKFGGCGYDHILTNIKPLMLCAGMNEEWVDTILYKNPARIMAYLD